MQIVVYFQNFVIKVCKCGNGHDDATLERLQKELIESEKMVKISGISQTPSWLDVASKHVPDFVIVNPDQAPVWEITGNVFLGGGGEGES